MIATVRRPFAAASVAILGAGVISMAPIAPPALQAAHLSPAVSLSAASDIFGTDLGTLDQAHRNVYTTDIPLAEALGLVKLTPNGQGTINFSTSYLSGFLVGMLSPILGPIYKVGQDFFVASGQEPGQALATLLGIPVDVATAFLIGGVHTDISAFVAQFGPQLGITFPAGTQIGINWGGLFSPGGSAFNSLDMTFPGLGPLATGNAQGPIGSLGGVIQVLFNGVDNSLNQFNLPAVGTLIGNVVNNIVVNITKTLGLGGVVPNLNLGGLLGGVLKVVLDNPLGNIVSKLVSNILVGPNGTGGLLGLLGDTGLLGGISGGLLGGLGALSGGGSGGLGGLFGLAAPAKSKAPAGLAAANSVPASVQGSLTSAKTKSVATTHLKAAHSATTNTKSVESVAPVAPAATGDTSGDQASEAAGDGASSTNGASKAPAHSKAHARTGKAAHAK
jgi:hypothetical protein